MLDSPQQRKNIQVVKVFFNLYFYVAFMEGKELVYVQGDENLTIQDDIWYSKYFGQQRLEGTLIIWEVFGKKTYYLLVY